MMNAMDTSINPCDDFYQFACGQWIKRNVIPEDKSSFGIFTKLIEDTSVIVKSVLEEPNISSDPEAIIKARDYYKACMNEGKIEEHGLGFMQQYLADLGGWPLLGSNAGGKWISSLYNLEDLLVRVRKESNYIPIVDIGVITDDKTPTKHVLYLDQPDLGMPDRDYYLKGRDDRTLMAYQAMIRDIGIAFGADPDTASTDARFIVDMEVQLANVRLSSES
ncbi:neprilysin-1-like isoform X2 [Ruditapes philippinarum]|nr:neprilysin-1-like isoform X2 [Ruditapes philippinarum]